jgi:hypothetical protein
LSVTRLREYVRLHLMINAAEGWTIESEQLWTSLDVPKVTLGV